MPCICLSDEHLTIDSEEIAMLSEASLASFNIVFVLLFKCQRDSSVNTDGHTKLKKNQ